MPAAKIIRAVVHVEEPVEVYRNQFADPVLRQQFFDFGHVRTVSVIETNGYLASRAPLRIQNSLAFYFICRHRFFRDHICPHFQTFDDELVVRRVNRRNDQYIRLLGTHHFFKIGIGWASRADVFFGCFHPPRIEVAQTHKLNEVAVIAQYRFTPKA